MRKKLLIVVMVVLALSVRAQFRETTWGMTEEEVINLEGEPIRVDSIDPATGEILITKRLIYEDEILDSDVEVTFLFEEGNLVGAYYEFEDVEFDRLKTILREKHGPTEEGWSDFWVIEEINTEIMLYGEKGKHGWAQCTYLDKEYVDKKSREADEKRAQEDKEAKGKL